MEVTVFMFLLFVALCLMIFNPGKLVIPTFIGTITLLNIANWEVLVDFYTYLFYFSPVIALAFIGEHFRLKREEKEKAHKEFRKTHSKWL